MSFGWSLDFVSSLRPFPFQQTDKRDIWKQIPAIDHTQVLIAETIINMLFYALFLQTWGFIYLVEPSVGYQESG